MINENKVEVHVAGKRYRQIVSEDNERIELLEIVDPPPKPVA